MLRVINRKIRKYLPLFITIIIIVIFAILIFFSIRKIIPVLRFASSNNITPSFIINLIKDKDLSLKNYKGRTNIILLGIGGGDHEGSDLTDTMMFISIDDSNNDTLILSIPRDLWMKSLKDKINTAYHYGEEKKPGGGFIMAKSVVEEVVNQPIQYAVIIDFSAFKKIIDITGGVDVNIDIAFEDKKYPIQGKENDFCAGDITFACRYETLKFEKGMMHMDGETALKYVRSRHAEGDEGTDYARSRRQRLVISALKAKLLRKEFIYDLGKLKDLLATLDYSVKADMDWSEKLSLARILYKINDGGVRHIVLDDGDINKTRKGFLINPPLWKYDGAWVLEPRTGNFSEIHEYVDCQLKDQDCKMKP